MFSYLHEGMAIGIQIHETLVPFERNKLQYNPPIYASLPGSLSSFIRQKSHLFYNVTYIYNSRLPIVSFRDFIS